MNADTTAATALIVRRTNEFREAHGLGALAANPALTAAARRFAEYMAATDAYGHGADGRGPGERAEAQGYAHCAIAENIAFQFSSAGFAADELAARLIEGWEKSPGHRRNMLLPQMVDIGVGIARSARTGRYYAVQLFARPQSAAVRFELVNRSDAAVPYETGGSTYTLPPRATRTHEGCFSAPLTVQWPDGPASPAFAPRNGARYVVLRDHNGRLRLQPSSP